MSAGPSSTAPARASSAPRRVLVTGATGNVGTALLRRLAREGVEVSGVARRVPEPGESPAAGARWHALDVSAPGAVASLRAAMAGVDAVVHLAWAIQPSHDLARLRATNVEGTRAVVEAALEAGVPHLVHTSSVGAYAPAADPLAKVAVTEDWPATGIPTSSYSRHKAEVEALLDEVGSRGAPLVVSRLRPGLVLQREAGSEIARYFAGPLVPTRVLGRLGLPVLPLPAEFHVPVVHADDLAAAFWAVLAARLPGALNVAADAALTPDDIARGLGAGRAVLVPLTTFRRLAAATWRLRLQPTSEGWVDLAASVPLQSTQRARRELGWAPTVGASDALDDVVAGMRAGAGTGTAPLARRTALTGRREPTS